MASFLIRAALPKSLFARPGQRAEIGHVLPHIHFLAPPGGLEPPAYGLGNCSRGHEDAPGGPRGHPGWQSLAKRVLAGPRRSYKRSHSSSAREGCARSTGGPRPRSRRGHRVPRGRGTAPSVRASSRLTRGGWCFRKGQLRGPLLHNDGFPLVQERRFGEPRIYERARIPRSTQRRHRNDEGAQLDPKNDREARKPGRPGGRSHRNRWLTAIPKEPT
jgi:hypothetical protein